MPKLEILPPRTGAPHPGYLADLHLHPSWAGPIEQIARPDHYWSPGLSVNLCEESLLSRCSGIVIDRQDLLVEETTVQARFADPDLSRQPDLRVDQDGRVSVSAIAREQAEDVEEATLLTNHGVLTVYGHFLFETLVTAWVLRKDLIEGRIRLLMNRTPALWPGRMLEVLGIPPDAQLHLDADHLRFRRLIVSSSCSGAQTFSPLPEAAGMMRQLKARYPAHRPGARFYVTRQGVRSILPRRIEDEARLIEALAPLGFVPIEPGQYSFEDQIRLFGKAEAVVGLHGSGMANAAFADPGCLVVDLLPDFWAPVAGSWLRNLTHAFGHRYLYALCRSRPEGQTRVITVDVPAVVERVAVALGSPLA